MVEGNGVERMRPDENRGHGVGDMLADTQQEASAPESASETHLATAPRH